MYAIVVQTCEAYTLNIVLNADIIAEREKNLY